LPEHLTHRRVADNPAERTYTVMSLYVDPTQFMSTEERERAVVNFPATCEYEATVAAEKARQKEEAKKTGGPRTAEGKARSSRNAVKHGFAGTIPVIASEDQDAYNEHLESYRARFQPADQPEADTVRRAAMAMWRLDRLYGLETIILNLEASYHAVPASCILPHDAGAFTRSALAFRESAGDGAHDLCLRYIQAASREHDRAIRTFYLLESKRSRPAAAAALDQTGESQNAQPRQAAAAPPPPPTQPPQPQQQQSAKSEKPNELLKIRSRKTIESLVNPYPTARNTRKQAATLSNRPNNTPKAA
jgi:hypothetical protein